MAKNSKRPGANLYNNQDGTYTGRVSSAPFRDFKLVMEDDEPLCLKVTAHDVFSRAQIGDGFTFKPNGSAGGIGAALGMQDAGASGGERLIPSEQEPTVVLRVSSGNGGVRFRLERHINAGGTAASLAGAFGG